MSNYYSPLRYPGGKNCIFNFVSKLFYENNLVGINYAEPYAGGAGLALRLLFEEYVNRIYINDLDRSIFAFWKTVVENSDRFCDWLSDVDVTMNTWFKCKEIQRYKNSENLFTLAKSTFFLNRTNISGVIKGGVIGGQEQKGNYKIGARFNKSDLIERIQKISRYKDRIIVSSLDGLKFVKNTNKSKEKVFFYLDPPYYKKGADLYMNFYTNKDHIRLSKYVNEMPNMWMVSYDNHEFVLKLFGEKKKIIYKISQSTSNRVGNEALIFSDKIQFVESMESLNSATLV